MDPSTVGALILVAICVLPGLPGNKLYGWLLGGDWREEAWSRVLRIIGFSVLGLMLYVAATAVFDLPVPPYLQSGTFQNLTKETLYDLNVALFGQFLGSAIAGAITGVIVRVVGQIVSRSAYGSAWEHFIRDSIDAHWVIVGLQNGDAYAGYISVVDSNSNSPDRDILLIEPARYDEQERCYRTTEYQTLFLAGATINSIATVHEPSRDKHRLTQPGENLFALGDDDEKAQTEPSRPAVETRN